MASLPRVCIVGAGAAGLWSAIRLVEAGWTGAELTIIEPDPKQSDDHTWSYWVREAILPEEVDKRRFNRVEVQAGGQRTQHSCAPYWYESVRSSAFYAYAKEVLAKAEVRWRTGTVTALEEYADRKVQVESRITESGPSQTQDFDYVLDSRLPLIDVADPRYHSTLQHFGGRFVRFEAPVLDPDLAVFMDFIEVAGEVAFLYVLPQSPIEGLVEIAVFSKTVWDHNRYDDAIAAYIKERYTLNGDPVAYTVVESEYGVIPMTDQPLWRESSARIWKIGTAGGWVQPSSGYAFTRCARFATEIAEALSHANPTPWRPSAVQQVFNSTMLGYLIDRPDLAGSTFYELFERNGAPQTFSFLDEDSSVADTMRLMWNSPRRAFARRALGETARRLTGAK